MTDSERSGERALPRPVLLPPPRTVLRGPTTPPPGERPERVPAYIEGTCQRNVPLYRRHGFVEHGTLDVPGGAPPMTPMWRDPR